MNMNITPGPWKGGQSIQSESGLFICRVLSSFDGWAHASDKHKFYSSKAPQNSEAEANARAIAEVPNLIEALKEFIDLCPRMSENDPIASALANQCQYAKLILKRIEG